MLCHGMNVRSHGLDVVNIDEFYYPLSTKLLILIYVAGCNFFGTFSKVLVYLQQFVPQYLDSVNFFPIELRQEVGNA